MTGFHGRSSLLLLLIIMLFFTLFVTPSICRREKKNPLIELSSRDQLVEMAGYGEERLSSVLVTGSVLCEACNVGGGADDHEFHEFLVSGALVAVHCKMERRRMKHKIRRTTQYLGKTDEYGDFIIELPSHLHALPHLDNECSVRVLQLPKNLPCRSALINRKPSTGIKLSSVGNYIRTYTTGNIRFQQPYKGSRLCLKKQRVIEETAW